MADAPKQDKPQEAPAKRAPDSGMGWWEKAKITAGAAFGNKEAEAAKAFENAEKPGDYILDNLAKDPAFQTPEGKKKLDTIRNDPKLMGALNKAISSDPLVKEGLMKQRGNIGGMTPTELVDGLQNEDNRRVLTSALNKVAEKPGDEFGLNYLNEIGQAGKKTNYVKLDELLEEGGIADPKVKSGAMLQKSGLGGLSTIFEFLKDPDKAIKDWSNDPNGPMAGMTEEAKNQMAGLLKIFAKMANAFMPGGGFIDPYMKLAGRIGDRLEAEGAKVRGQGVVPEPDGIKPSKDEKVGTAGDKTNTQVADANRPTAAFNPAASGTPGQVAPAQTLAANDPVFRQTGNGGPGLNTLG